jgi:hypothetical protein
MVSQEIFFSEQQLSATVTSIHAGVTFRASDVDGPE